MKHVIKLQPSNVENNSTLMKFDFSVHFIQLFFFVKVNWKQLQNSRMKLGKIIIQLTLRECELRIIYN